MLTAGPLIQSNTEFPFLEEGTRFAPGCLSRSVGGTAWTVEGFQVEKNGNGRLGQGQRSGRRAVSVVRVGADSADV